METTARFLAQYSTTEGDMWVSEGEFATEGKAQNILHPYRQAGHAVRVIRFSDGCPVDSISNLLERGLATVCV